MQLSVLLTLGATSLFLSTAAIAQRPASAGSKTKALSKNLVALNTAAGSATPGAAAEPTGAVPAAVPKEVAVAKEFKGTVVNEMGKPLAGAVVSIISGNNQFSTIATTNAAGEYLIYSRAASPMLLVSYAGYIDIQQRATYAHPITFQLEAINNYNQQLKKQTKSADKAWRN